MQNQAQVLKKDLLPPPLCAVLPPPLVAAALLAEAPFVEELRLHVGRYATLTCGTRNERLNFIADERTLREILQKMCQGSLYAYSQTINQGYLCMPHGIRVGVCGSAATEEGRVIGVQAVSGLVIRIPHAITVDATPILQHISQGGILIYAPPGVGKTTLLRAVAKGAAAAPWARRTVVVDARGELKDTLEGTELLLDILVGYPRALGIEIAVRSLGAQLILCDEISSAADAHAILEAAGCGVPLIATVHAASVRELWQRPPMAELLRHAVFQTLVGLSRQGNRFFYRFDPLPTTQGARHADT